MNKQIILSFYFLAGLFANATGQICTGSIMNTGNNSAIQLCYKESDKFYNNTYTTKFSVYTLDGPDLYTVILNYTKGNDSVYINTYILDELTHKTSSTGIKWRNDYLTPLVKDYQFNDATISQTGHYQILFTIPDSAKPYIELNHFQSLDSPKVFYQLYEVNKLYLDSNLRKIKENIVEKRISDSLHTEDSLRVDRLQLNVATWINLMKNYKDDLLNNIRMDEKGTPRVPADLPMKIYFESIIDSLLAAYNFNDPSITSQDFRAKYKFLCNSDGYLEGEPGFELSDGSMDAPWFNSKYFNEIVLKLKAIPFQKSYATKTHNSIVPKFNFLVDSLMLQFASFKEDIYFDSITPALLKRKLQDSVAMIIMELEDYKTRKFTIPVSYDYRLHFQLKKIAVTWKAKKEKNGSITITDETKTNAPEPITDCIRTKFEQLYDPKVKTYRLYIQKALINDKQTADKCILFKNE